MFASLPETADGPNAVQVWEEETDEQIRVWYVNPSQAVSPESHDLADQIEWFERFGGMPSMDSLSARYVDAVRCYHSWLGYWTRVAGINHGKKS